jgi:hypothetical protein
MQAVFRYFQRCICLFLFLLFAASGEASAQPTQAAASSTAEQIASLQEQLSNAWRQVETIVNQPVRAYRYNPDYNVSVYSPGWFHPGAITPDFNTVDVRQSQQLIYTNPWVSSDLNPTLMFLGRDLEFNAMTKLFYTNRSLPKKKLTEAEMLQINSLYRTIGHCQGEIQQLQNPPQADAAADTATDTGDDTNAATAPAAIAAIASIPRQTRILYGSIGIGALVILIIVLRLVRKKPEA